MELITQAAEFAMNAHAGQVRKYTGEPYFTHVEAVAEQVSEYYTKIGVEPPEEVIAAALLHDTVEDCPGVTIEQIEYIFGETVARYVWFLTKPPGFVGNRGQRKATYNAYLSVAPFDVKIIKFFDMRHNSTSIEEHDPNFWETFREETKRMLIALNVPDLHQMYPDFIHRL
jgi:(p)ppGpp synthase/HD superfamily hydrolase